MAARNARKIKLDRRPPGDKLRDFLSKNRRRFPSNSVFAREAECSEGRLSQILNGEGGMPSPELSIRIHGLTDGAVPGSDFHPELWRSPAAVPIVGDIA